MSSEGGRVATTSGHRGPGRPSRSGTNFPFKTGDLVLVKWNDGMVYFAKIKRIDQKRCKCVVVFDDKSQDEAHFSQIHSVDETTTDIICIKCKKDASSSPNEIVLCDTCGIGFHQKCHNPQIPATALELDTPWNCIYCLRGTKCPYLTESLNALQNLLSDDDSNTEEEAEDMSTIESDQYEDPSEESVRTRGKKKSRKRAERPTRKVAVDRRTFKGASSFRSSSRVDKRPSPMSTPEALKHKLASTEITKSQSRIETSPAAVDSDATYSPGSTPEPSSGLGIGIKRKKIHVSVSHRHKRQKRSSVEARTVSVTRLTGPISTDDSSASTDHDPASRDSTFSEENFGAAALPAAMETENVSTETRPRSLRVSLTFPEEVEPGTPLDKVKKLASPPHVVYTKSIPWDDTPSPVVAQRSPVHVSSSHKTDVKSSTVITTSPFDDVGLKPKKRNITALSNSGIDVAFKASPLPRSTSTSPQKQLDDEVFQPSDQSEAASMAAKPDVHVLVTTTDPAVSKAAATTNVAQSKQIKPVASAATGVSGNQQNQQVKVASTTSPLIMTPQLSKRADGLDCEKHRPIILTATTATANPQTPGVTHIQPSGSFEITPKASGPPVNKTSDLIVHTQQPGKVSPSAVSEPLSTVKIQTDNVATTSAGSPILATPKPQPIRVLNEKSITAPNGENDVIITGVENARASLLQGGASKSTITGVENARASLLQGGASKSTITGVENASASLLQGGASKSTFTGVENARASLLQGGASKPTISPIQAQRMVIEGHRRAHELSELTKGREVATTSQRPKTIVAKTVDIQSPVTSQAQSVDSIIMPVPNKTPVVPVVVTPTPPVTQYNVTTTPQIQTSGKVAAETPMQQLPQSKGVQTLYYRMQDQNGQQVYIPIASTTAQQPPSQPMHVILTTPSQADTPSNVSSLPVDYSTPEGTGSLPTQSRVGYASISQPSVPNSGKVTSVSGVSTTKPSAIALRISSVEHSQVTQPPHHNAHPSLVTKAVSSAASIVTVDTRNSASPTHESVSKQNDTIQYMHRSHTVLAHAPSQSNTTSKIVSRATDKEDISTISKKVGDALTNMNPELLMSAFEDAWKKFQANERFYKTQRKQSSVPIQSTTKRIPPPNVEVLPSSSKSVSLIRQMGTTKPRMIAPKPYSRTLASTPPATIPITSSSPAPTTPSTEYAIYTSIPQGSSQQQQVVIHPVYTLPAAAAQQQKTYQVQTAGLFYPASIPGKSNGSQQESQQVTVFQPAPHQAQVLQTAPRQTSVSQSKILHRQTSAPRQTSVVHTAPAYQVQQSGRERVRKGVITSRESGGSRKSASGSKQNRHCARCGGDATYLCSGCHMEWYCGRDCQLKAWDAHSEQCKA